MQVVNLMKVVPTNARRDTTNDSLSICIIAEGFPPEKGQGGVATYTYNIALGLARRGHRVQVITRGWDDDRIDEIGGVRVYRVSIPGDEVPVS